MKGTQCSVSHLVLYLVEKLDILGNNIPCFEEYYVVEIQYVVILLSRKMTILTYLINLESVFVNTFVDCTIY